jgi:solute carrier family 35 protein C2
VSIPCGLITAADVGLSNLSLVRISLTFFTMVKSSSPIWVLLSAFIFGIEQISCNLIAVGVLIMAGELLTAFGEVEFDTVGFLLCAGAAVCSGIRWTLVQLKVQRLDPPLKTAVVTMRVLAPSVSLLFRAFGLLHWLRSGSHILLQQMFFFMLILSFLIEDPIVKLSPENGDYFADFNNTMKTISLGLTGATIAIAMVLCEFWLILKANAIVLMIGGVLKEVITILVG